MFDFSLLYMLTTAVNFTLGCCASNKPYLPSFTFPFFDKRKTFMISKLVYRFRYLSKRQREVKSTESEEVQFSQKQVWKHENPTALAVALSLELQLERYGRPMRYDVLLLIASRLHYADIVSLSLLSHALRRAIFPPHIRADRSETLRIQSCKNGTKTECWICRSQICQVGVLTAMDSKKCRSS